MPSPPSGPSRRAVFLDRDGVLNALVPDPRSGRHESPYDPADVQLLPGVPEALNALRADGRLLCVVSNQPAAAKGTVSLARLRSVDLAVRSELNREGLVLDGWRVCIHHPEGVVAQLTQSCACRKPEPGMLLDLARELDLSLPDSWIVGDSDRDVEAGRAAGCRTALVETVGSEHRRHGRASADAVYPDLASAARGILSAPACSDPDTL